MPTKKGNNYNNIKNVTDWLDVKYSSNKNNKTTIEYKNNNIGLDIDPIDGYVEGGG